jgi:hypothetical protein
MVAAMAAPLLSCIPGLALPVDAALTVLYRVMEALVGAAGGVAPFTVSRWPLVLAVSLILIFLVFFLNHRIIRSGERLAPFAAP